MSETTAQQHAHVLLRIAWSQTDALLEAVHAINNVHSPLDHDTVREEQRCFECRTARKALGLIERLERLLSPTLTR